MSVRAEQVLVIFQQARPAVFISVLIAGIVCLVLRDVTDRRLLLGWFATVTALAVIRLALSTRFKKDPQAAQNVPLWERRFVGTLGLTGLAWGVGGWLIMPSNSLAHQAVVYFFLMGMAGGAVASYSAHATSVSTTIVAVMLPVTLWFVVQDEVVLRAMAVGGMVYIAAAYRATKTLAFFLRRSFQLSHELRIAHEKAQQLARTDELTGMMNRRAFYELGDVVFKQALRHRRKVSALMLDVDRFKRINDTLGHAAGDQVIKAMSEVVRETVRATDIAGRVGGEEFGVLLPDASVDDAMAIAERLRRRASEISIHYNGVDVAFTCSLGVAEREADCDAFETLLAHADAALYQAKDQGRNRVVSRGGVVIGDVGGETACRWPTETPVSGAPD